MTAYDKDGDMVFVEPTEKEREKATINCTMRPSCHNRPPFNPYVAAPIGWTDDGRRDMTYIPDEMSKTCQQHGPMGEATLHPERWDCEGCKWKPEETQK